MTNPDTFLKKYEHTPFELGSHDCIRFIQKYTTEVFGKELLDLSFYTYTDFKSAQRNYVRGLKRLKVKSFNEYLSKTLSNTIAPRDGDIVAKPDIEGLVGHSYGVVLGGYGFFVDYHGLTGIPLDGKIDLYWRVN